ncbi:hypothetical protein VPH35_077657 [Triticum aestivum]|uniref:CCHC-type domain-containing protein n=1 Tax=Aegilops tauschii subsp. strangulata TaxID=200361 RepID=A0A453HUI2_AEGTS
MWRRWVSDRGHAAHEKTSVRPRREVSPEMAGLCFRCFEEGHFRRDCTNDIVCFRCDGSGHCSKDCKRPRSPSPEGELRRHVAARVDRADQAPSRRATGRRPSPRFPRRRTPLRRRLPSGLACTSRTWLALSQRSSTRRSCASSVTPLPWRISRGGCNLPW